MFGNYEQLKNSREVTFINPLTKCLVKTFHAWAREHIPDNSFGRELERFELGFEPQWAEYVWAIGLSSKVELPIPV